MNPNGTQVCFAAFALTIGVCLMGVSNELCAQEEKQDAGKALRDSVEKIFIERCFDCHSGDEAESGFRLDVAREKMLSGGDSETVAIVPGDSADGSLIEWVTAKDPSERMPPDGEPLSKAEIDAIRGWIDQGAILDSPFAHSRNQLWSFRPIPPSVEIPRVSINVETATPIDEFIARKLVEKKLRLNPPEEKSVLIRRLFLVTLGIPPSPAEVDAFVNDPDPDAYEKRVDQLLAHPGYGEKWAQHWLDIIRFGETHGFETNRERPNAWRYRDYVIDALNSDKPYDRFVREQLAGDALGSPVATGYIVAGPHDIVKSPDVNLTLMQRQDELADIVNVVGTSLMGLTVGCARCHNHKFDPISQKDFYSMQAIFAGVQHADRALPPSDNSLTRIKELDRQISQLHTKLSQLVVNPAKPLRPAVTSTHNVDTFEQVDARWIRFSIDKSSQSQPCIDELEVFAGERNVGLASYGTVATSGGDFVHRLHQLKHINDGQYGNSKSWIAKDEKGWVQLEFPQVEKINRVEWARDRTGQFKDRVAVEYRIEVATQPGKWRTVASSNDRAGFQSTNDPVIRYDFSGLDEAKRAQGEKWLDQLREFKSIKTALSQQVLAYAGTFAQPEPTHRLYRGDPLQKRERVAPDTIETLGSLNLPTDTREQKRRMAFAEWLTQSENPLVARVVVNRLWQHTFGTGIVGTPNDFGNSGRPPTHPGLLDWLARSLIDSGWSLKQVHRQILLSKVFTQSSQSNEMAMSVDSSCSLWWRFPPRRLEAEAIRDSILEVSGSLDHRLGGPGFSGFEVAMENVRHFFPKKNYGPSDWRRMIYMTKVRQEKDSVFGAFDCPDASQIISRRSRSTTPLQSLNLLNSRFVLQQSEIMARRLERDAKTQSCSPVQTGYRLVFSRDATPEEIVDGDRFILEYGLPAFCRVLLNANEFVFLQ